MFRGRVSTKFNCTWTFFILCFIFGDSFFNFHLMLLHSFSISLLSGLFVYHPFHIYYFTNKVCFLISLNSIISVWRRHMSQKVSVLVWNQTWQFQRDRKIGLLIWSSKGVQMITSTCVGYSFHQYPFIMDISHKSDAVQLRRGKGSCKVLFLLPNPQSFVFLSIVMQYVLLIS